MIKILHISDLHNHHPEGLPKANLLIISGDYGFKSKRAPLAVVAKEFKVFNNYLKSIRHKYDEIIYVPGNHDTLFELDEEYGKEIMTQALVLINESFSYKGLKIYGSPVTPSFCNWAFNVDRGEDIRKVWDRIPLDTDVLITHGPPYGILDVVEGDSEPLGCEELRIAVERVKPQLHLFGHIHSARGVAKIGDTTFSNASIMNERYYPVYPYNEFEIKGEKE